jgi:hypothetical protein
MKTFVGDLTIDASGNLSMLSGEQAASEVCRNFAQTQKGEMIFKAQEGMPFIGGVFDDNDLAQFEAAFKRRIKQVPFAEAQVIAFDAEVVENVLNYEAVIQTKFGQMVQNGRL